MPEQYVTSEALVLAIAQLNAYDTSTMQEYKVSAESAIAASLRALTAELVKRQEAEAAQAELAELRKKQAERDEADRVAEQKRQDDARVAAAAEALAAKKVDSVIAEVKQTTRQEVIAELAASNHNDPASDSNQGHGEPETVEPFVYPEVPVNKVAVENEIIRALMEHTEADHGIAMGIVESIAKGLIPHISIQY